MGAEVTLHPLPIEARWTELEEEFLPRVGELDLEVEVNVEPQGLVASGVEYAIDLIVSVPWSELPPYFALLLNALVVWRKERAGDDPNPTPYRVQVIYRPDGTVLKELVIPESNDDAG